MKTKRIWFTLSVGLLGVLAVWMLNRSHVHPQEATPPGPAVQDPVPVAEAVAPSTPPFESRREDRNQPAQAKRMLAQATEDPEELADLQSPVNSQDLTENREWARNFPAEALVWLKNAPDGDQRIAIAEIACPELAQTDPAEAVTLVEDCLNGSTNAAAKYLVDNLVQEWAGQDMQAASDWALAKPEGEQRDRLLQRIAIVESMSNPVDAAGLVVLQMSPGPLQNEAAISVIYQWAQKDAAAALAWAEAFPAGDLRERAIDEVINVYSYSQGQALDE